MSLLGRKIKNLVMPACHDTQISPSMTSLKSNESINSIRRVIKIATVLGTWPHPNKDSPRSKRSQISRLLPYAYAALMSFACLLTMSFQLLSLIVALHFGAAFSHLSMSFTLAALHGVTAVNILIGLFRPTVMKRYTRTLQEVVHNLPEDHATTRRVKRACWYVWAFFISHCFLISLCLIIYVLTMTGFKSTTLETLTQLSAYVANATGADTGMLQSFGMMNMLLTQFSFLSQVSPTLVVIGVAGSLRCLFDKCNEEMRGLSASTDDSISALVKRHMRLSLAVDEGNKVFGIYLLLFYLYLLVKATHHTYHFFNTMRNLDNFTEIDIALNLLFILDTIFMAIGVTYILASFNSTVHSVELNLYSKLVNEKFTDADKTWLSYLLTRLVNKPVVFTANEYLNINKSFLLTMLGVYLTYIVVLMESAPESKD